MDKPIYIDTYFRIESGYESGPRNVKGKDRGILRRNQETVLAKRFHNQECKYGGCPEVVLDKTRLYCHPQELSGPVRKDLIEHIEKILTQGTTFQYLCTDTYGEILDLTEEKTGVLPRDS